MTPEDILPIRLYNQQLVQSEFKNPEEIVSHIGAVQSQDYPGAKWALSQRLSFMDDQIIEKAFSEGKFLRTHVMRPTWHFVAPEDIRWIQQLTSHRVKKILSTYDNKLEIDAELLKKTHAVLKKSLQNNNFLTRNELAEILEKEGIPSCTGQRIAHIIMHAELDAIICSGPRRDKQFTYALIEERAPQAKQIPPDLSLIKLTQRYFTSHGPALLQDFVWWSGLTVAEAKKGLELSNLHKEIINNQTYWFSSNIKPPNQIQERCYLLPNYDEYTIAYKERSLFTIPGEHKPLDTRGNTIFNNAIILNGKVAGTWRKNLKSKEFIIEYVQFYKFNKTEHKLLNESIVNYAHFLGLKASTILLT